MKPVIMSPETVLATPIAVHLARELAEQPVDSVLEIYRTAVEIALSFSTGSALEDEEHETDAATDREAATRLVDFLHGNETLSAHRGLTFPQAVVSTGAEAPTTLVPPQVASHEQATAPGKPAGALWTSSFLTPDYPAWAAMVDTGYLPVQRPFSCMEFLADPDHIDVFTIDSRADYAALCDEFAAISGQGHVSVDWRRVAESYHAVHLSFQGLLLVQNAPVHSRLGPITLRCWDSESTAWLRLPESAEPGRSRLVG